MKGGPHHLMSPHIMTDNGAIHDELVSLFASVWCGEFPHAMPPVPGA
jgi:hypothetical protein